MKTQVIYRYKINFGFFADDFILGVVCAKIGLVKHALNNMESIRRNRERLKLFNHGVEDAVNCKLEDLAQDLWVLRERGPNLFDTMVLKSVGRQRFKKIRLVIENRLAYKPPKLIIQSLELLFQNNYE